MPAVTGAIAAIAASHRQMGKLTDAENALGHRWPQSTPGEQPPTFRAPWNPQRRPPIEFQRSIRGRRPDLDL